MNRSTPVLIGIVSATVAGSVVAQSPRSWDTRLIAPDERAWFDRHSLVVKKKIMADLQKAKACISVFGKRDGPKDAMTAASLPRPQFYTGLSDGVVVYRTVPGIKGCSSPSTILSQDQPFKELPEAYSGPTRSMRIQALCGAAASRYAAAFNQTRHDEASNVPRGLSNGAARSKIERSLLHSTA